MTIVYLTPKLISIGKVTIEFNENREKIREKLGNDYIEDNQVIPIGELETDTIYQRRDIFNNLNSTDSYFFLNYDINDSLSEIEVHKCDLIIVNDFSFGFNDELDHIVSGLAKYSSIIKKGEGEFFLSDIKVSIIDKNKMGGEGSTLGYFYCAEDVSHLEN